MCRALLKAKEGWGPYPTHQLPAQGLLVRTQSGLQMLAHPREKAGNSFCTIPRWQLGREPESVVH